MFYRFDARAIPAHLHPGRTLSAKEENMADHKRLIGHLAALMTIIVWGVTFISTKVLLQDFTPLEILFIRFMLGWLALCLVCPRRLILADRRQEWLFAFAGLTGVTLYFLLENMALTYSLASNVGVIVAVAPFFTALLAFHFLDGERPHVSFFVGFGVAITGIGLISFNGSAVLRLNPLGDLLAVLAALVWAVYSILTRKIGAHGYGSLQATRRIFFYGLLFILPCLPVFGFSWDTARVLKPVNFCNLLFLGFWASALCFVTWTFSIRRLGAIKTVVYIYLVPVVTVLTSMLVLHERVTWMSATGTALTLLGLAISEMRRFRLWKSAGHLAKSGQA